MRDRMEIISLAGYTGREKLEIARRYLVRRQLEENGLKPEQCEWQEEALVRVIDDYTHEAGVRELERQIGAVCRGVAAQVARGKTEHAIYHARRDCRNARAGALHSRHETGGRTNRALLPVSPTRRWAAK